MKKLALIVAGLWAMMALPVLTEAGRAVSSPKPTAVNLPVSQGQMVLRLPYHKALNDSNVHQGLAIFWAQVYMCIGSLVAADWQGNFYLYDPTKPGYGMLNCYNSQGKLQESWGPISSRTMLFAAVTRNNFVWCGTKKAYREQAGLPVVMFRKGQKHKSQPLLDWRERMPDMVFKKLAVVAPQFNFTTRWDWKIDGIYEAGEKVLLQFSGSDVKSEEGDGSKSIRTKLEMLVSHDGKKLYEMRTARLLDDSPFPDYAPSGVAFQTRSDFNSETWKVSKLWVWKQGKPQSAPLIELNIGKPSWLAQLKLGGDQFTPVAAFDSKENLYLMWSRDSKAPEKRFVIEGHSEMREPIGSRDGEKALVVLNKTHKPIAYVPWTTTYWELSEGWYRPVPDGRGFYRIQFDEKEARVYFHALPKTAKAKPRKKS